MAYFDELASYPTGTACSWMDAVGSGPETQFAKPGDPQFEEAMQECVRLVPLTVPQMLALAAVTADHSGGAVVLQLVRVGIAAHIPHEGHTFYSMLPDAAQDLCKMLNYAIGELENESSQSDPSDT